MSLDLFNAVPAGAIEVLFDKQNQPWFKRAHVGKFLGLPQIEKSLRALDERETSTRSEFDPTYTTTRGWSGPKGEQNKTDKFLSKKGLLYVINKCKKPTSSLKKLAEFAGVELHENKWLFKEQESILSIIDVFKGEDMLTQFSVDQY